MRLIVYSLIWVILAVTAMADPTANTTLPTPPQQSLRWTPPKSQLPPELLAACQDIFDLDFADPRGCEYREVVLQVGQNDSYNLDAAGVKTRGWVLPAQSAIASKFAIAWNGAIYPLVSVGPPADIDADMAKLLAQDIRGAISYSDDKFKSGATAMFHSRQGRKTLLKRLDQKSIASGHYQTAPTMLTALRFISRTDLFGSGIVGYELDMVTALNEEAQKAFSE